MSQVALPHPTLTDDRLKDEAQQNFDKLRKTIGELIDIVAALSGGSGYTDEEARDAVIAMLTDSSTIDFTGDDGADTITADVKAGSIGDSHMASGIDAAKVGGGAVSNTEFSYLDGVTSAIQTQLNARVTTNTSQTISAAKLFGTSTMLSFRTTGTGIRSNGTGNLEIQLGSTALIALSAGSVAIPAGNTLSVLGSLQANAIVVNGTTAILSTDPSTIVVEPSTGAGVTIDFPYEEAATGGNFGRKIVNSCANSVTASASSGGITGSTTVAAGKTAQFTDDGSYAGQFIREVQ